MKRQRRQWERENKINICTYNNMETLSSYKHTKCSRFLCFAASFTIFPSHVSVNMPRALTHARVLNLSLSPGIILSTFKQLPVRSLSLTRYYRESCSKLWRQFFSVLLSIWEKFVRSEFLSSSILLVSKLLAVCTYFIYMCF